MARFNIGGVPEHFNLPWHLCIEDGTFESKNLTVYWKDFPGGTGAMCQALRNKEIDIAIVLTEGAIYDIAQGNNSKIISWYVTSPLIWGIHTAASSKIESEEDMEGCKYAI
ncbi:MAG: ABC transporter substrate-binding protein, partial [Cyclobacteriaceae bacterium]